MDWNIYSPTVYQLLVLIGALVAGRVAHALLFHSIKRVADQEKRLVLKSVVTHLRRPARFLLPVVCLIIAFEFWPDGWMNLDAARKGVKMIFIVVTAWLLICSEDVIEDVLKEVFNVSKKDNRRERVIHTQLNYLRKMMILIIVVVTVSLILMSFEEARRLGAGLLTSAGVIGIMVGLAAQTTIGNLLAGFQIAFTQPIRYDDVVIVENEWGWIEEITLTYVVVRIWDQRRLVLPLSYFIEKPFQNWTRRSAEILGTIFIYTDYTVPVAAIREELTRLLDASDLWDKRVNSVQVTNATDRTMEVRALVSAADSGRAWDLRCYIRENLITFLQKNYPQSLPKVRIEPGHDSKVAPVS